MQYKIPEKISWKEMNGFVVVVDTSTGEYYSLNQTASIIWQSIADQKGLDCIREKMTTEYQAEESEVEEDIKTCINQWLSFGIMQKMDAA